LACVTGTSVVLLDGRTGQFRAVCQRKGERDAIYGHRIAFSPQGDMVAACGSDGGVVLWDTATGTERGRIQIAVEGSTGLDSGLAPALACAPDGKTIAAAALDQSVRLLDVAAKKETNGLDGQRPVRSVVITPDGRTVITGHVGGQLRWWEAATGKPLH